MKPRPTAVDLCSSYSKPSSQAEQVALLRHIESKVRGAPATGGKLVMENGDAVLVAPPGAPAMTPEVVKTLLVDFP